MSKTDRLKRYDNEHHVHTFVMDNTQRNADNAALKLNANDQELVGSVFLACYWNVILLLCYKNVWKKAGMAI